MSIDVEVAMPKRQGRGLKFVLTLGFLSPRLRVVFAIVAGVFVGLGLATAHVSRSMSYML